LRPALFQSRRTGHGAGLFLEHLKIMIQFQDLLMSPIAAMSAGAKMDHRAPRERRSVAV
jgi:hypothetical protein